MLLTGIMIGFFGLLGLEATSLALLVFLSDRKHEPPTKDEWKIW